MKKIHLCRWPSNSHYSESLEHKRPTMCGRWATIDNRRDLVGCYSDRLAKFQELYRHMPESYCRNCARIGKE